MRWHELEIELERFCPQPIGKSSCLDMVFLRAILNRQTILGRHLVLLAKSIKWPERMEAILGLIPALNLTMAASYGAVSVGGETKTKCDIQSKTVPWLSLTWKGTQSQVEHYPAPPIGWGAYASAEPTERGQYTQSP